METAVTLKPIRIAKPTYDELANTFVSMYGNVYRFFHGGWNRYSNGYWMPVEYEPQIDARSILVSHKDTGLRPSPSAMDNLLRFAQLDLHVDSSQIDKTSEYINLNNGLFNLNTMTIEPHRKDIYSTSQLPFSYDERADCPNWRNFLYTAFSRNGDVDLHAIVSLQQAMGYSLTDDTKYRLSFWLLGRSGTGKSTILNVLIALAGNSHIAVDLEQLGKTEYQLADVAGKRVVTFAEPPVDQVLNDGVYKRLVSQDTIVARRNYGDPFRYVPIAKVWGAMNQAPRVLDRSDGVFNRVVIFNVDNVIDPSKRDPHLIDRLRGELPGIFNWAMEGLSDVRAKDRIFIAPSSINSREEYRSQNDPERAFVDECLVREAGAKIDASSLYALYSEWCKRNGLHPKNAMNVARDWTRLGMSKAKSSIIYYQGFCQKLEMS